MLNAIELGQVAETVDGQRRVRLLQPGLVWLNGPYAGSLVQVQSYLLSDLWIMVESDSADPPIEEKERVDWQSKRIEMLENQLFEQRARRFDPPDIKE